MGIGENQYIMITANEFMFVINDKNFYDFKKMKNKYGEKNLNETIQILKKISYKDISIKDFQGHFLKYLPNLINVNESAYKALIYKKNSFPYSVEKMESEIESTLQIENIHSNRNSIRHILNGNAPTTNEENKIYGIKKGLDFISRKENKITEENLYKLYVETIGKYLTDENKLLPGNYYRHDSVYIVGNKITHCGISYKDLPNYMKNFICFINEKDSINTLIKSTIIHFYFAYLHPYFDGNGRIARLIQLWYLLQNDFDAALLVSFSNLISETKNEYYKAFEVVERNYKYLNFLDVTPFIIYFSNNVLNKIKSKLPQKNVLKNFQLALDDGEITPKEKELFLFVMSNYGNEEFSTKQLEKDFQNAAYATIRTFVSKFEKAGILEYHKYKNRPRYNIKN